MKRGNIYIPISIAVIISTNHLSIDIDNVDTIFSHIHNDDTIIKSIAATMSCTMRNHIAIFPYMDQVSHLSEISFIIIIVLLNVIDIAIYRDSILLNHNNFTIKNPIIDVKKTCQSHVINDTLPVSLIILAFNHIPTINSNKDIHILEKISNTSV
jgi:hypothetical protein